MSDDCQLQAAELTPDGLIERRTLQNGIWAELNYDTEPHTIGDPLDLFAGRPALGGAAILREANEGIAANSRDNCRIIERIVVGQRAITVPVKRLVAEICSRSPSPMSASSATSAMITRPTPLSVPLTPRSEVDTASTPLPTEASALCPSSRSEAGRAANPVFSCHRQGSSRFGRMGTSLKHSGGSSSENRSYTHLHDFVATASSETMDVGGGSGVHTDSSDVATASEPTGSVAALVTTACEGATDATAG